MSMSETTPAISENGFFHKQRVLNYLKRKQQGGTVLLANDNEGYNQTAKIKPQDHGIKKTLLRLNYLRKTIENIQKVMLEILPDTTDESLKNIIIAPILQMETKNKLFTETVEKYLTETSKEAENSKD